MITDQSLIVYLISWRPGIPGMITAIPESRIPGNEKTCPEMKTLPMIHVSIYLPGIP